MGSDLCSSGFTHVSLWPLLVLAVPGLDWNHCESPLCCFSRHQTAPLSLTLCPLAAWKPWAHERRTWLPVFSRNDLQGCRTIWDHKQGQLWLFLLWVFVSGISCLLAAWLTGQASSQLRPIITKRDMWNIDALISMGRDNCGESLEQRDVMNIRVSLTYTFPHGSLWSWWLKDDQLNPPKELKCRGCRVGAAHLLAFHRCRTDVMECVMSSAQQPPPPHTRTLTHSHTCFHLVSSKPQLFPFLRVLQDVQWKGFRYT